MGVLLSIAIYWKVSKVTVVPSRCLPLMRVQDVQQRVHNIQESTPGKLEVLTRLMLGWTSPYKPSSNIIRRKYVLSLPKTIHQFIVFSCFLPKIWYSMVQSPFLEYLIFHWKFPMENCHDGHGGFRWIPVHPVVPWDHRSQCPWSTNKRGLVTSLSDSENSPSYCL